MEKAKRVAIQLLRWSTEWEDVRRSIEAVLESDFDDFRLLYTENHHDSAPSLIPLVDAGFGDDARLQMVRNETNLGYAGAHNEFFATSEEELLMVLNPDAVIDRSFLRHMVAAFDDPRVAAATGKMLKPMQEGAQDRILDGTGIEVSRARRGRERGQWEVDRGQYDEDRDVFAVSGTAAMYRNSALQSICIGDKEYFDSDFFAYWEDLDLSWRLRLRGYQCRYVSEARVEHARAVGSSPGGIRRFKAFLAHRRSFPRAVRQWSWRNHIFCLIKNDAGACLRDDLPRIVAREAVILAFLVLFTPDTLLALPQFFRLLPRMLRKRRVIQSSAVHTGHAARAFFA